MQCPNADEIIYTLHEREYVEKIEKAYGYASKTLLDLLMDERALMDRLRYGMYLTYENFSIKQVGKGKIFTLKG